MKSRYIITIICLSVLLVAIYFNWKYEVVAINIIEGEEESELKVMTWNVHCSEGADSTRQRKIAELILNEDADFVQLNEYNQDSCTVIDSLLKIKYPFTEEYQSHKCCGDIFYSKRAMTNSGHVYIPIPGKLIQTIKATIAISKDSVQIFGVHMASNHYDESTIEKDFVSDTTSYDRYKGAQGNRCFQAHWTKRAVQESEHPVIVMGDMNDFSCSAPLDTFMICDLKNAWWEDGNGYGCTFHNGWLRLRIDHILYSEKLKLCGIKVIETDLSDHNPIVAGFSVNN